MKKKRTPPEIKSWSPKELGELVAGLFRDFAAHGGDPLFLFRLWARCLRLACGIELDAEQAKLSRKVRKMRPRLISVEGEMRRLESDVLRAGARPLSFPVKDGPDQVSAQVRARIKVLIQEGSMKSHQEEGTPARLHSRAVLLSAMETYMDATKKMSDPAWQKRWLRAWVSAMELLPPQPDSLNVLTEMLDRLPRLAEGKMNDSGVVSAFTNTFREDLVSGIVLDPLKWWNTQGKKKPGYALCRRMGRAIARSHLN